MGPPKIFLAHPYPPVIRHFSTIPVKSMKSYLTFLPSHLQRESPQDHRTVFREWVLDRVFFFFSVKHRSFWRALRIEHYEEILKTLIFSSNRRCHSEVTVSPSGIMKCGGAWRAGQGVCHLQSCLWKISPRKLDLRRPHTRFHADLSSEEPLGPAKSFKVPWFQSRQRRGKLIECIQY